MKHRSTVPSYGAIVIEESPEGYVVLMVGGFHGWSFPKGHREQGESPEETAHREVLEETGIAVDIDTSFSRTVRSALPGDDRTVTFFLGKSPDGPVTPVPQEEEVGEARWMPVEDALGKIFFEPDRRALSDALNYMGIPCLNTPLRQEP